ncbi:MAG: ATP-binding cassette domain-containing protein [Devosia sp.]
MSDDTAVMVVATDISRTFDGNGYSVAALKHASCKIVAGDRVAIVGRSGSGKSTLLHILSGLDVPSEGRVGWPTIGAREKLRPAAVGVMFQFPSLVPWLTVQENVALPLQLAGRSNSHGPAADALARFELKDLADRLPDALSGGQAQRVALVRAIVADPVLVFADEPTGQIDYATALSVMKALIGWADETGATVVVATHDMSIAHQMTRQWSMDRGTLIIADQEVQQ